MRGLSALAIVLLGLACAPQAQTQDLASCADIDPALVYECGLSANAESLRVRFIPATETLSVEVLQPDGRVRQQLLETGVAEFRAPRTEDVDGDGRADLVIPVGAGNVNTISALWVFGGEGLYRRLGEVSGYAFARTDEGLLVVSSRTSAAAHNVAFYALGEASLDLIASVDQEAEELAGGTRRSRCALADAPGIEALSLSTREAELKFCAAADTGER